MTEAGGSSNEHNTSPNAAINATLIDLGSSCYDGKQIYSYIGSRFYRAPEVILQLRYSFPMDIWALGVMLPELLTGRPLFPGEDEAEQLALIQQVLGMPPNRMLNASPPSARGKYYEMVDPQESIGKETGKDGGKDDGKKDGSKDSSGAGVGSGLGLLSRHRGVGEAQPYYRPLNTVNSKGRKRGVASRTLKEVIEAYLRAAQHSAAQQAQAVQSGLSPSGASRGVLSSSSSSLASASTALLGRAPSQPPVHQGLSLSDPQMQLFIDFVSMIVQWQPEARPTPLEASRHPWVRDLMPKYLYDPEAVAASIGSLAFSSTAAGHASPSALVPPPRPQFNFDARIAAGASGTPSLSPTSALSPIGRQSLSVGPTSNTGNAAALAAAQRQQQSLGPGRRPRRRLSALHPGQSPAGTALSTPGETSGRAPAAQLQGSGGPGLQASGRAVAASLGSSSLMASPQAGDNGAANKSSTVGVTTAGGGAGASNSYYSRGRTLHRVVNHSNASGLHDTGGSRSERDRDAPSTLVPRPPPPQGSPNPSAPLSAPVLTPLPPRAQAAGWAGVPGQQALLSLNGLATVGGGVGGRAVMQGGQHYSSAVVSTSLSPIGHNGVASTGYGLGPPLSSSSVAGGDGLVSGRHRSVGGLSSDGMVGGGIAGSGILRGRGGLASVPASYRLSEAGGAAAGVGAHAVGGLAVIMEETTAVPSMHSSHHYGGAQQRNGLAGSGQHAIGGSPAAATTAGNGASGGAQQGQPWQRRRQQYYQAMAAVSTPPSSGLMPAMSHTVSLSGSLSPPSSGAGAVAGGGSGGIRQALLEARGITGGGGPPGAESNYGYNGHKLSYSSPMTFSSPASSTGASAAAMAALAGAGMGISSIPRLAPSSGRLGSGGGPASGPSAGGGAESKSIGRLLAAARQIAGPSAIASAGGGSPS
jgi:serine/threonine protein kinase